MLYIRSYSLLRAVGFASALLIAGCSDRMLDTGPINYMTGGGPPVDGESPVRGLSPESRPYPNLASVPPRPTDTPSQAKIDAQMARLGKARAENRDQAQALSKRAAGVTPLDIPPPPKLTPGAPSSR